ncbi:hypothetical protein VE02_06248 [Pseudogymnoascus sp. 03VT05]|nr:hypothetical protein VE02_06248 [Pseudogymnoascus sp. 03VT05]
MPLRITLNPKAPATFPPAVRAAPITLEQYEQFPLHQYDPAAPFTPANMPTKKTRLDDDNTVGKTHLLQALNQVPKATIKSFDAFISDRTINPAFLEHSARCLDSEGQAMLYRPRNTALGLIPLIRERAILPFARANTS